MSKEINKYLNLSIVMSVLFAILGVILVVSPNSSLDTIAYLLAAFLLVYGTYNFIDSFAIHPIFFFMKMASSVISILLGIIIFLNPEIFKNLIPIALGIFFIINGIFKTRMAFIIKNIDNYFVLSVITSVLTIICGITRRRSAPATTVCDRRHSAVHQTPFFRYCAVDGGNRHQETRHEVDAPLHWRPQICRCPILPLRT